MNRLLYYGPKWLRLCPDSSKEPLITTFPGAFELISSETEAVGHVLAELLRLFLFFIFTRVLIPRHWNPLKLSSYSNIIASCSVGLKAFTKHNLRLLLNNTAEAKHALRCWYSVHVRGENCFWHFPPRSEPLGWRWVNDRSAMSEDKRLRLFVVWQTPSSHSHILLCSLCGARAF